MNTSRASSLAVPRLPESRARSPGGTEPPEGLETTRPARERKRINVPRGLAARAVGCAQCASVAVINTRGHQTSTAANDPIAARQP
jgi:hypothetical protein